MVEIVFLGHSFFKIESNSCVVYIDPFSGKHPHNQNKKFNMTKHLDNKGKPSLILISHEHFDHFDKEFVEELSKNENTIICAHDHLLEQLPRVPKYKKRSVKANIPVNIFGVTLKPIPVHHPNSFDPWGFELNIDKTVLFHTGDTHLSKVFNDVKADVLMLPIGGMSTMDVVDAVRAVKTMKPNIAIPMHYNTFNGIMASTDEFVEKIKKSILKTKPVILSPGQNVKI